VLLAPDDLGRLIALSADGWRVWIAAREGDSWKVLLKRK
jgi:hypothetical protein